MPLHSHSVSAGFPSPADDYIEAVINLNEYLIANPAATFMLRACGDSMINAGIQDGDMLIVDKSIKACHGKIVIAAFNGELTVKRLSQSNGCVQLLAANPNYPAIAIPEGAELVIWGVVVHVIRSDF